MSDAAELDIPVIDLGRYLADASSREATRVELLNVLSSHGFMYVRSSHFSAEDIDRCLQENVSFFERFPSEFLSNHAVNTLDRARRGYSPPRSENFGILVGRKGLPNDRVEKFRFGPFVKLEEAAASADPAVVQYYGSNEAKFMHFVPNNLTYTSREPDGEQDPLPLFEEAAVQGHYNSFAAVAAEVLAVLEDCLELPSGYFDRKMDKHTSIMTFNCYKGEENTDQGSISGEGAESLSRVRIAEHTDVSMLTLLLQSPPPTYDEAAGCDNSPVSHSRSSRLQVRTVDTATGAVAWESVPYKAGGVIVNVGDCLSYWTGSHLASTLHRVVDVDAPVQPAHSSSGGSSGDCSDGHALRHVLLHDRYSVAFFVSPNYDAVLEPHWHGGAPAGAEECPETPLSYSAWRKQRIKSAMKHLTK